MSLDLLGMAGVADRVFREGLGEPNGIILVTGPTGSGKTTTLYAGLQQLNDGSRNILTVEDPVEYEIEGVGQTQRSEEQTSELQSIMRNSYAVFCWKKQKETRTS